MSFFSLAPPKHSSISSRGPGVESSEAFLLIYGPADSGFPTIGSIPADLPQNDEFAYRTRIIKQITSTTCGRSHRRISFLRMASPRLAGPTWMDWAFDRSRN